MPKGRLSNPSTAKDGRWFAHIGDIKQLPTTSTQDMYRQGRMASKEDQRLPLICVTQRKFAHIGDIKQLPTTSTQDMYRQGRMASKEDQRLPLICVTQRKFAHIGDIKQLPTTSTQAMYRQGRMASKEDQRLPLICVTQRKGEVNNGFPFSMHDNRHSLQYNGEYFDTGLGRRRNSNEKSQHISQNVKHLCHDLPGKSLSNLDRLTNYQTDFALRLPAIKQPSRGRFPKNHLERAANQKREHVLWFAECHAT